jgi:hypothetical protein
LNARLEKFRGRGISDAACGPSPAPAGPWHAAQFAAYTASPRSRLTTSRIGSTGRTSITSRASPAAADARANTPRAVKWNVAADATTTASPAATSCTIHRRADPSAVTWGTTGEPAPSDADDNSRISL